MTLDDTVKLMGIVGGSAADHIVFVVLLAQMGGSSTRRIFAHGFLSWNTGGGSGWLDRRWHQQSHHAVLDCRQPLQDPLGR